MSAKDYLLAMEWNMGNGQCPECCGVPADWFGHPLYKNAASIGHKKDCKLAAALVDIGDEPLMIGRFRVKK